jgi:hypothetical protein
MASRTRFTSASLRLLESHYGDMDGLAASEVSGRSEGKAIKAKMVARRADHQERVADYLDRLMYQGEPTVAETTDTRDC